jgi:cyclopropane fatty-acyl-phospholipid synthase-like methyltransferase
MKHQFAFDQRYYARYYENPKTRVGSKQEAAQLGRLLGAYLGYLGQPVRNVLDMGCGVGHMRAVCARVFPGASYTGVEHSEYMCERYGWQRGSVVDWKAPKKQRYDLLICRGVLQYLTRPEADAALENLARLSRGALYLEALTREDWERACDQKRTDGAVYLRPASFYRTRLRRGELSAAGAGLFLHERSPAVLYALETL